MERRRLKNYIISCDVDKKLADNELIISEFDCPIQAGAALTDIRLCQTTDMDNCPDNISKKNRRYK